jgi:hypothetical protein
MIPALYTFAQVYKQSVFETQAVGFIQNEISVNKQLQLLSSEVSYEENSIELNFFNEIGAATKEDLISELRYNEAYKDLKEVNLKILGSDTSSYEIITKVYEDTRQALKGREAEIEALKTEITDLKSQMEVVKNSQVIEGFDFVGILQSVKSQFIKLQQVAISQNFASSDMQSVDTTYVFNVAWKDPNNTIEVLNTLLKVYVEENFNLKNVSVVNDLD